MKMSSRFSKGVAAFAVSAALVCGSGAGVAAADPGPGTGSADAARSVVELIVCFFRGELVGSKYPLC
ncbi:hypothetical protein IU433_02200 [Nocardia puris]|uniref:Secreted protein n=1 Tax=Nocardia puris TaxID=208602 RepID=A0A366DVA8_9NOCA|nr:hypothetical protein [Nocardia puris]MBF6210598.1 hypothetical protein [Nocardia puris]MBF6369324.1 hypothetical protein [Nocardia puris]MBF6457859.1 hypothetical protein [Nocardia puris]RBO94026.1 hypothetical protein DFR74_102446 [Nocardia puris]